MPAERPARSPFADAAAHLRLGDEAHRHRIEGGGRTVVGRGRLADIKLDSVFVAPAHAVIERRDDGFWIIDQSVNGTELNGERLIVPALLRHGDRLLFADAPALFELSAGDRVHQPTGEE